MDLRSSIHQNVASEQFTGWQLYTSMFQKYILVIIYILLIYLIKYSTLIFVFCLIKCVCVCVCVCVRVRACAAPPVAIKAIVPAQPTFPAVPVVQQMMVCVSKGLGTRNYVGRGCSPTPFHLNML